MPFNSASDAFGLHPDVRSYGQLITLRSILVGSNLRRAVATIAIGFWDRIARGQNVTKIGGNTNPRDVASQIAAQGRAAVDCPLLQCVGPQSTNQAMKAVAIARTYLRQSDASGSSTHPDIAVYPEFVKLDGAAGAPAGAPGANDLAPTTSSRRSSSC